ncbi:MAG TPA: helix-turn-helix transcriptional regulator [Pseudonocardiaceae bacterium]|nr:helix-turn-helix transcriptional regulator [Pseudonocardiaceae bacterium]
MGTDSSPTLHRRRLARRLRQMREKANMTIAEAAPKLDKTKSALGRIETGETGADIHLVRTMMDVYDQYDKHLPDLVRAAMQPAWWTPYGIRDRGFLGLETDADEEWDSSLSYVPGLLQTEEYMRAVFSNGRLKRSPKQLEGQVGARLFRQGRLTAKESPLTFAAIIDESALRKPTGGREVMRDQLKHLIEATELATVTIQVLPDELGSHPGLDGAFTVLEFEDPEDPSLLYVEYPTGAIHVEKTEEVTDAKLLFSKLRSLALSPAETVEFIRRVGQRRYSL